MDSPEKVEAFYLEKYHRHGPTPEGMSWRTERSHHIRLRQAYEMSGFLPGDSVLDVGCGVGMVVDVWRGYSPPLNDDSPAYPFGSYVGVDLVKEYTAYAQKHHEHRWPYVNFIWGDFLNPGLTDVELEADITLAIGTTAWLPAETAYNIIGKMWSLTRKTMVFTALIDRPFPMSWLTRIMPQQLSPRPTYWGMEVDQVTKGEAMFFLSKEDTVTYIETDTEEG